jgi:predicted dehydrogenase
MTPQAHVNIGVIGCGAIAQLVHLRLLPHMPGLRVTALADPDSARLDAALRRVPGASGHVSVEDLLERAAIDAVVVSAPTHLHARIASAALARGAHVYLEKPIASNLDEGRELLEPWRRSGLIGMIGFNCRFNPFYRSLRSLLREGRAGTAVCARTVFSIAPRELPVWKRTRSTGGGVLLDLGSHHIDLMRFLFAQEITRVRATLQSRLSEADTALLELELDGGAVVQSFFSLCATERDEVEVFGDRARLAVGRFTSFDVEVRNNPAGVGETVSRILRRASSMRHVGRALRARRAPLREPGYALALEQFLDAVRAVRAGGSTPGHAPDFADGFACLQVIDAAERSARSGTDVTVRG